MALPTNDPLFTVGMASMCILLRFSADLISEFSEAAQRNADAEDDIKDNEGGGDAAVASNTGAAASDANGGGNGANRSAPRPSGGSWLVTYFIRLCNYPSSTATATMAAGAENGGGDDGAESSVLLSDGTSTSQGGRGTGNAMYGTTTADAKTNSVSIDNGCEAVEDCTTPKRHSMIPPISLGMHLVLFAYFLSITVLTASKKLPVVTTYGPAHLGCIASAMFLGIVLNIRDYHRRRFSTVQRILYTSAAVLFLVGCTVRLFSVTVLSNRHPSYPTRVDAATFLMFVLYTSLVITECRVCPYPNNDDDDEHDINSKSGTKKKRKAKLTPKALLTMLQPYFWPHATSTSATLNRLRALATWLCVFVSKACSVLAPILLGKASTALTRFEYGIAVRLSVYYAMTKLGSMVFKEGQGLLYMFVAQAAFVELSEVTFEHLHSLSLDWHLKKKLGETIRSMDRGIGACDSLMRYLFLFLVPAIAEVIVVVIIFASYFDYFPLAVAVFAFVFVYGLLTILMTLWRKKFRNKVVKSDNDWHDICTDSLVNFETVKYFTAEDFELKRFVKSIERYQTGSVNVKASLSSLNISQQILIQACLATCLSLAVVSIRNRIDCCISFGCDKGNSECCSTSQVCSGLEMGDFIAVLTYTLNLFAPLNYLGSIYNSIVMSMIDLANLSELLVENPDVVDLPNAIELPETNQDGSDVVVEFDDVIFHYPTQPDNKGLKGLSFQLKKGQTTAIVGPTGEGKTTVSRLLFRFYDVLGGSVKINGVDSRRLKQKSLRGAIGVVPQNNSLFNDTLKTNIKYGRQDATDEEIMQAIEDAQLKPFIDSLPEGWDTMVGDRGLKLSGGEQQRAAIARCLLKNPSIVVLDEATSALDTLTENSIQQALDRLGNDRTVLVIAHRLGTIKRADNIIVLGDGKVAESGTHDELLALGGKYAEMWNMQLHSAGGN